MILSDGDIRKALAEGRICCSPDVRPQDIRPTGIRLHLDGTVLRPASPGSQVELGGLEAPEFHPTPIPLSGLVLLPGEFALGSSLEHIGAASDLVCQIDGRSTVARLGLMVHCGSTTFDHIQDSPRSITFELVNLGPYEIRLRRGDAVALLSFVKLSSPVEQEPSRQYDRQSGPLPANIAFEQGRTRSER